MARQVIELATVFNGVVQNRRYEADHVNATAKTGDVLAVELTGCSDEHGPLVSAIFTPNHVAFIRPLPEGGQR